MALSAEAQSLNAHLLVTEEKLVSLSEEELTGLLTEIGYGGKAAGLLVEYRALILAFREKMAAQK